VDEAGAQKQDQKISESISPFLLLPFCDVVDGFTAGCHLRLFGPEGGVSRVIYEFIDCGTRAQKIPNLEDSDALIKSLMPKNAPSNTDDWSYQENCFWLLFCSIPTLEGVYPGKYLNHHFLLVQGIYLLLKDEISPKDIAEVDRILNLFCEKNEELFGRSSMSDSLHELLHCAYSVVQSGPLWSCALPFFNFVAICRSRVDKIDTNSDNMEKFAQQLREIFQTAIVSCKHFQGPACNFFGPGSAYQGTPFVGAFPQIDLEKGTFFEAAKSDGLVYQKYGALDLEQPGLANPVHNFCYQDEQGRELCPSGQLHFVRRQQVRAGNQN
jgi:hypothetical protein